MARAIPRYAHTPYAEGAIIAWGAPAKTYGEYTAGDPAVYTNSLCVRAPSNSWGATPESNEAIRLSINGLTGGTLRLELQTLGESGYECVRVTVGDRVVLAGLNESGAKIVRTIDLSGLPLNPIIRIRAIYVGSSDSTKVGNVKIYGRNFVSGQVFCQTFASADSWPGGGAGSGSSAVSMGGTSVRPTQIMRPAGGGGELVAVPT